MKLSYYPETDSLYIELKPGAGTDALEIADGVLADIDSDGRVVGVDIDQASNRIDVTTLEVAGIPQPDPSRSC